MAGIGAARRRLASLVLLGLLSLGACATPQATAVLERPAGLPPMVQLTDVPFHAQEELLCGPASLAMALNWAGMPVTPDQLEPLLFTPGREGTLQTEMVSAARRLGFLSYRPDGLRGLLGEVAAGHPVVVLQNLGLSFAPVWHYAVVIGYDLDNRELLLHSGTTERQPMGLKLFERTWARGEYWAAVLLPPGQLPATARELPYLEAALGLEKAARHEAAAAAFAAAAAEWPDSLPALMGLGNNRYSGGDLRGAARAFSVAVQRHPESGAAYNNLAHVLFELGQRNEAIDAARRAVQLGGPQLELFRSTLTEIEAHLTAGS